MKYKTVILNVASAYMEGSGASSLENTQLTPDLLQRADEIFNSEKVQKALIEDRELAKTL